MQNRQKINQAKLDEHIKSTKKKIKSPNTSEKEQCDNSLNFNSYLSNASESDNISWKQLDDSTNNKTIEKGLILNKK